MIYELLKNMNDQLMILKTTSAIQQSSFCRFSFYKFIFNKNGVHKGELKKDFTKD